jgi:dihydrofolate reductase
MTSLRVCCFSLSLDGYGAGPDQDENNPIGIGGMGLHTWLHPTRTLQTMFGNDRGETGVDDDFAARGIENIGAWILGRNMFGPVRGPWSDDGWKGWWGDIPPYHCDVFVLTHYAREPLAMQGGTTFYFVTEGIDAALDRAKRAAGTKDVRLGGGVAAIRQYLEAALIDELHVAVSPVLLGTGEPLFAGLDLPGLGYRCEQYVATAKAAHYVLARIRREI